LETLRIKQYLVIIFMILTLTSCSNGEDKMEIIAYGTSEFDEFVKKSPISLDEAWEIQLNYMKKNINDDFSYNFYKTNVLLFCIVDENYVFTTKHMNDKMKEGYFLSGVWVDMKTGNVFEKNVDKKIKPNSAWRKQK